MIDFEIANTIYFILIYLAIAVFIKWDIPEVSINKLVIGFFVAVAIFHQFFFTLTNREDTENAVYEMTMPDPGDELDAYLSQNQPKEDLRTESQIREDIERQKKINQELTQGM